MHSPKAVLVVVRHDHTPANTPARLHHFPERAALGVAGCGFFQRLSWRFHIEITWEHWSVVTSDWQFGATVECRITCNFVNKD